MKTTDIIKEIDPDYETCFNCDRVIHISNLMILNHGVYMAVCNDINRDACLRITFRNQLKKNETVFFSDIIKHRLLHVFIWQRIKHGFKRTNQRIGPRLS